MNMKKKLVQTKSFFWGVSRWGRTGQPPEKKRHVGSAKGLGGFFFKILLFQKRFFSFFVDRLTWSFLQGGWILYRWHIGV